MDAAWIVWIVVVLASFGVLEWVGWRRARTGGTLSYLIWRVLFQDAERILRGEHPRRPRTFVYVVVSALFVWLVLHFVLGGRLG